MNSHTPLAARFTASRFYVRESNCIESQIVLAVVTRNLEVVTCDWFPLAVLLVLRCWNGIGHTPFSIRKYPFDIVASSDIFIIYGH